MKKADRNALVALPVVVLIAAGVALAGSQGGSTVGGFPVFALCVLLAFAAQWAAFVPAFLLQTERFYDITGSLTYVTVTLVAVLLAPDADARAVLLLVLVVVWAVRLGSYLLLRIRRSGKDDRFDAIKPSFVRFLNAWTLQGLWISLTLSAALAAITSTVRESFDVVSYRRPRRVGARVRGRGRGRCPEAPLSRRRGQSRSVHQRGALVLVATSQLLR